MLLLTLASAFIAASISYAPSAAWPRFGFIVAGLAFYVLLLRLPAQFHMGHWGRLPILGFLLALLPDIVIIYFTLTNDWTYRLGKLPWLDPFLHMFAAWQPAVPSLRLDSNAFGGVIAALAPLQWAELVASGRKLAWIGVILLGFSAASLLLSESRGAWMGLTVVFGTWMLWRLNGRLARRWAGDRWHQAQIASSIAVLVWVVVMGVAAMQTSQGQELLRLRGDRLTVWRNSLDLASDYPFTGLGLGGFGMAYSSYVLLLHVPYVVQASNLYLDVWIEQGLLGLAAFAGLVVFSVLPGMRSLWRGEQVSRWQIAAFASLGVVLVHGIIDDPFYGYGGLAIPFLFVPLGLLSRQGDPQRIHSLDKSRFHKVLLGGGVIAALVGLAMLPAIRSMFVANLGALSQTQAELSVYAWPAWPIQDELRRSGCVDLAPAIAQYEMTLAIDPHNVTANRRLGQIELARGQYASARRHLEAAFASGPDQRATRQLLGESYAIAGGTDRAIALWKNLDVSNNQLAIRQWWYVHIGEPDRAALIGRAALCCGG